MSPTTTWIAKAPLLAVVAQIACTNHRGESRPAPLGAIDFGDTTRWSGACEQSLEVRTDDHGERLLVCGGPHPWRMRTLRGDSRIQEICVGGTGSIGCAHVHDLIGARLDPGLAEILVSRFRDAPGHAPDLDVIFTTNEIVSGAKDWPDGALCWSIPAGMLAEPTMVTLRKHGAWTSQ